MTTKDITLNGRNYSISSDGKIFLKPRTIQLSNGFTRQIKGRGIIPYIGKIGYMMIGVGGKQYYIHRLIATLFLPNPQNLPCINHIDGDKTNNNLENLEWCTYRHNNHHAFENKLIPTSKPVVCVETGIVYKSQCECARKMNIWQASISKACRHEYDQINGYHFEFYGRNND